MRRALLIVCLLSLVPVATAHGLILGPYAGQVVDAQDGQPIEGAVVLFSCSVHQGGIAVGRSSLLDAKLVYTDKAGTYQIPRLVKVLGLLTFFNHMQVMIYQPGYKLYSFHLLGRMWEPSKSANVGELNGVIALERIPPNFDHEAQYQAIHGAFSIFNSTFLYEGTYDPAYIPWEFMRRAEWEKNRSLNLERRR